MNETIVKHALRELIIYTSAATEYTRAEALDELLRMERETIRRENSNQVPLQWNASMSEFRVHRMLGNRIATIKLIREKLGCGLSEALIIVKGIEAHCDIPA